MRKSIINTNYFKSIIFIIIVFLGIILYLLTSSSKIEIDKTTVSPENNSNVPTVPINLKGKVISYEQIEISWINKTKIDFCNTNNSSDWRFVIEREDYKGKILVVKSYCKNEVNSYTDKGLNENSTYKYRIYFENDIKKTPISEVTLKTLSRPNFITICNQVWQTKNLDVTSYNDGTPIPQVTNFEEWKQIKFGAWCYYKFNAKYGEIYGKIYNGYAIMGIYNEESLEDPVLRKSIAPSGWHVPRYNDFKILIDCLGGEKNAGGKMKETGNLNDHISAHWIISENLNQIRSETNGYNFNPEYESTNESGFTGLPSGYGFNSPLNSQYYKNLKFIDLNYAGYWWCIFDETQIQASVLRLNNDNNFASLRDKEVVFPNGSFYSIRCLKDNF